MTEQNEYFMPLTQQELSETTGMSPAHMNRAMKELTLAGFIKLRSKRMTILDLPGIQSFCEFEPSYFKPKDSALAADSFLSGAANIGSSVRPIVRS